MKKLWLAAAFAMLGMTTVYAQPVEYVRVCDTFGTGYFYVPGTDTCQNSQTGQTRRFDDNAEVVNGVTPQQQQILDATSSALRANEQANAALQEALEARARADQALREAANARARADNAQRTADRATEGVAINLSMPNAQVSPGHNYAAAFNIGTFGGKAALGASAAIRATDNVTLNGSVGLGLDYGTVGASGGMNISW